MLIGRPLLNGDLIVERGGIYGRLQLVGVLWRSANASAILWRSANASGHLTKRG